MMFRRIIIILFLFVLVLLVDVTVSPNKTSKVKARIVQLGDKNQAGTYSGHTWQDNLSIEIKSPEETVYWFQVGSSACITLHDQRNGTRTEMTPIQMSKWLDVNKSDKLCTMIGVYNGKVSDLIVLVPAK